MAEYWDAAALEALRDRIRAADAARAAWSETTAAGGPEEEAARAAEPARSVRSETAAAGGPVEDAARAAESAQAARSETAAAGGPVEDAARAARSETAASGVLVEDAARAADTARSARSETAAGGPEPLRLELRDTEWPCRGTDHHRQIVRAMVVDDAGWFYFVRACRDDEFGKAVLIESSGGGVEPGEDPEAAIRRELAEELGAQVEILGPLGLVSDYYNLIRRHNLNHYYLCRVLSFGTKHLTPDEVQCFHLSTLRLRYGEALREYEARACTPLGRLIAARELPILRRAGALLGLAEAGAATVPPPK